MKDIKIYDSLEGKLKKFNPIDEKVVKIYVCGPTVYNLLHIGNARPMIVFDSFRRFLEYIGYKVIMVQNFTDIDDKIIEKANQCNSDIKSISERYINEYWKDSFELNIRSFNYHPKTTNFVKEIIDYIEDLIKKEFAYKTDNGDVYFDVNKFESYGKLSNRKIEDMKTGTRIKLSENKKNPLDFVLWKSAKKNEPFWESPWGNGRPGWHIECSVMATEILGEMFDIHAGGNDLLFPHHENERAQSIAKTDGKFANYWMHNGMINLIGEKMAKSVGNIWLIRDAVQKYGSDTLKVFILSKHYRSPIDLEDKLLLSQKQSVDKINKLLFQVEKYFNGFVPDVNRDSELTNLEEEFIKVLSEDFNTPKALAVIFNVNKKLSKSYNEKDEKNMKKYYNIIRNNFGPVLGVFVKNEKTNEKNIKSNDFIDILLELREEEKKNKNYKISDFIRDKLQEKGVKLKDTKDGTEYEIL